MFQPTIIVLKEGTDTSQGKPQLISNINACNAVAEILQSTLGPRGMDKLIYKESGSPTISNDGATIINLLDIVHPAAKTLVDIARSQDAEVGDGTTSVVLLAAEFLKMVKGYIEDNVHPQTIVEGFRIAKGHAIAKIHEISKKLNKDDIKATRHMLTQCAKTAMNSKLIANAQDHFAPMVVDAVLALDPATGLDLKMIGTHKVAGGSSTDSQLINGVAFKKTFSYAGFEMQEKHFKNPKVVTLNVELELKSEKSNAEIKIKDPEQFQSIVDAEWKIIYQKLEKIVASGAKVVLSRLPIGDIATQYFADRGLFCAGRVPNDDLQRVCKATGSITQTSLNDLSEDVLGTCGIFEEVRIGSERFNVFRDCPAAKTVTMILRGGAEQFIEETERSLHDAIMVVKRAVQHGDVVGGGGAIEMEISKHLREKAREIRDKKQLIVRAFARAFEVIPRQLADNAGFDSTDIVNELRQKHSKGFTWAGVDIENEGVCDTLEKYVWEPALNKINAISAATEAACVILSVDETIKSQKQQGLPDAQNRAARGARPGGMPSIR